MLSRPLIKCYSDGAASHRRCVHIARSVKEMREYTNVQRSRSSVPIGFVPTMGALHSGHVTLMQRARRECGVVVASIFVNPSQFSPGEDLDKYPRQFESDLKMLESAGVDCVFAPSDVKEMYRTQSLCHVEPAQFCSIHEGVRRPEFFRGVATVVTKLFNIVQPSVAYFGQKDVSQCILIQRMVSDLNIPVDIQVCETIRETNGLAMSSRNAYLSAEARRGASVLYRGLRAAEDLVAAHGSIPRQEVVAAAESVFQAEPLVTEVEYVSLASHRDMRELDSVGASGAVLSAAIRLGGVRLIDNLLLGARCADDIFRLQKHSQ